MPAVLRPRSPISSGSAARKLSVRVSCFSDRSLPIDAGSDVRPLSLSFRVVSAIRSPIEADSDVRPQCSR